MDQQRAQYLVGQFLANQLTAGEQQEFHQHLQQAAHYPTILAAFETLGGEVYASDEVDESLIPLLQRAPLADKPEKIVPAPVHRVHFLRRWGWAAAILVMLLAGAYLWRVSTKASRESPLSRVEPDVAPGRDGAILTLADGRKIVLDSLGNGTIANQNGTSVVLSNGQLLYNDDAANAGGQVQWNTMHTPKGRQFNVTLPDGTRVWLNAASSITYPTAFAGDERRVELTGEAYFEVAKDKTKPFYVKLKDQAEIQVLGTHFNVNGYEDEPLISTTLLEGSVRVSIPGSQLTARSSQLLAPNQQARISNGVTTTATLKEEEIDKVMAWRNGAFNFEGASLQEVMRQLARWYDIDVVYEKGIPNIHFVGEMSRDISLAGVLKALEASNVHFHIEDNKRLIVQP